MQFKIVSPLTALVLTFVQIKVPISLDSSWYGMCYEIPKNTDLAIRITFLRKHAKLSEFLVTEQYICSIPGIVDDLIIIIGTLDEPKEKGKFQFQGDCE
jgi:hypothetical protein